MTDNGIPWRKLHAGMKGFSEADLQTMLDTEMAQHKRPAWAVRIHQRLCNLRTARERAEIMERLGV